MIEFNCLIHKETDTIIEYDKWLGFIEEDNIELHCRKPKLSNTTNMNYEFETFRYSYKPKDMLLSDDFKIIYNHDFTFNELREIQNSLRMKSVYESELANKVSNLVDEIYKNEIRYNLEV